MRQKKKIFSVFEFRMIFICFALCGVFFSGCVSLDEQQAEGPISTPAALIVSKEKLTNIEHVYAGMTESEVKSVMGDSLTIGYERQQSGDYVPSTVPHPYKEEEIILEGKSCQIRYYLTTVLKADGIVAEDELTPVVFCDGAVTGKGWDFCFKFKEQARVK